MGRSANPGENVSQNEQHIRGMAAAVTQRPVHEWESPEVGLSAPLSNRIRSSTLVAAHMVNLNWRPGAVDLRKVGAYQPTISLHALDDVLFGPRPPMLADFWDDAVSARTTQPVSRKVIRTRADEFPIAG